MKKLLALISGLVATAVLISCGDNGGGNSDPDPEPENEVRSGLITANETWTADNIYELDGRVIVDNGVQLTIEAGTIIKGREGVGQQASVLIISRGASIRAIGTAASPIIFTSVLDNIEKGQSIGTNLGREDKELWGGLIVLGSAPISAEDGDTEASIEGIPADDAYGLFGGDNPDDNSGTIQYVSVRHGGSLIGEGNEINGITFGGVGAGTTVENVEVYATLDDGLEFFGGTVDVTNALVYFQGDDGVDIDMNYAGTVDNFIVIHGGTDTDEGLEIDGPENDTYTDGLFTLVNGYLESVGGDKPGTPADLKSGAQGTLENIVFAGYGAEKDLLKVRASYNSDDCSDASKDAFYNLTNSASTTPLVVTGSNFTGTEVYSNTDGCDPTTDNQGAADAAAVPSSSATGANASVFDGWTAASQNGEI